MRTAYHHADARAALIEAGFKLLETTPATALSLRQVAGSAGLSRQASYNHFDGKDGLLAALAQASFTAPTAAMDDAFPKQRQQAVRPLPGSPVWSPQSPPRIEQPPLRWRHGRWCMAMPL